MSCAPLCSNATRSRGPRARSNGSRASSVDSGWSHDLHRLAIVGPKYSPQRLVTLDDRTDAALEHRPVYRHCERDGQRKVVERIVRFELAQEPLLPLRERQRKDQVVFAMRLGADCS